jgi:hypothetical protein
MGGLQLALRLCSRKKGEYIYHAYHNKTKKNNPRLQCLFLSAGTNTCRRIYAIPQYGSRHDAQVLNLKDALVMQ